MRETTPAAMPPCFDRWSKKFDDLLRTKAQKREFRHYLGGLLGESGRKNLYQMASDSVGVTYHKLHHFLTEATWSADKINGEQVSFVRTSELDKEKRSITTLKSGVVRREKKGNR